MRFHTILCAVIALFIVTACSERPRELFNEKDLTGWDTWLGPKFNLETHTFDTVAGPGLNNDPEKVFSVVDIDDKSAIRISGAHFGGISTTEEFQNYHLTLEFRWGSAKYAPKDSAVRDSGLLYHAVGPHGAADGFWMRSQEFQIQEGDCGDYWGVEGGVFDIMVSEREGRFVYDPAGKLVEFGERSPVGRHAVKFPDAEKPSGEWNTVDLYCLGDTAVHVMNGKVNMILYNSRQYNGDSSISLKRGKIQLQSEGAEIFYRNIRLEGISRLPKSVM